MKDNINNILNTYLSIFPEEKERQEILKQYIQIHNYEELIDWNNFDGHIVASGFIYSKEDNKFLVLYHNDLKMYLYPGGHIDSTDINILSGARREVLEETGLSNLKYLNISDNELIPLDIDTHKIKYNERLDLPEHYHFDFRYLFIIDKIQDIKIDINEMSDYKWISLDELIKDSNYSKVVSKIKRFI